MGFPATILHRMSIPELVGELVKMHGSLNAASRKADIPVTTLYRLYKGERKDASLETMRRIAHALHRPLHEIIRDMESDNGDVRTEP